MITVGEPLNENIISLIKKSSTPDDRRKVCLSHNLSKDLVNAILRRDRNITEENKKLILDIIKTCRKNIKNNLKLLETI